MSAHEVLTDSQGEVMSGAKVNMNDAVRAESIELEAMLISRAYLYTLFHKLSATSPNSTILDTLLSQVSVDAIDEYANKDATLQGFNRFLGDIAMRADRDALLDAAQNEFTRLFIGPAALPALPWESPYLTNEATVFQANTLVVRSIYRAHGLEPACMLQVPDDHVSLECAFMAKLAVESVESFSRGDIAALALGLRAQQSFVDDHLSVWLGSFAKRLRTSKTAVLYPQMMEALAAFVDLDAVFLVEASFWAESLDSVAGTFDFGASLDSPEAASFLVAKQATAELDSQQPFGSGDYEFVSLAR